MKQKLAALLTVAALALCALPMAVSAEGNVAKSGNQEYATLQEAINNTADEMVTLISNTTENVVVPAEKTITLDLNGFTLDGGTVSQKAALTNNGTITVQDSSEAQTGTIKRSDVGSNGSYYTILNNKGTMNITGGTIKNDSGSPAQWQGASLVCNGPTSPATLNISGGVFEQANFIAVKNDECGTLNVTGGTINSQAQAIQNWCNTTIQNVELNGSVTTWTYNNTSATTNILGGTINGNIQAYQYGAAANKPSVSVSGTPTVTGTFFVGCQNNGINTEKPDAADVSVSGGTFSNEVPADFLADGFAPTLDPITQKYDVTKLPVVATVGGTPYYSLAKAATAAAATPEKTLTLEADATLDSMLTINTPGMVIDLGDFTVSASDKFQKDANNKNNHLVDITADNVTLKNGTLKAGANNNHTLNVWNAKGVQLSGLKLDNAASYGGAPLIVGASAVTVNDGLNVVTGANSWYGINVDSRNVGSVSNPNNKGASITVAPDVSLVFEGQKPTGIYMENSAGMHGEDVKLSFGSGVTFNSGIANFVPVVVKTGQSATVKDPANAGLQDNGDGTFGLKPAPTPAPTPKPEEPWTPGPTATPAPAQVLDSTPKTGAVSLAVLPLAGLAFAGLGFVTRKREE